MKQINYPMQHPSFARRHIIQAGSIGLLGLGMNHLAPLRALADRSETSSPTPRSVILFFFPVVLRNTTVLIPNQMLQMAFVANSTLLPHAHRVFRFVNTFLCCRNEVTNGPCCVPSQRLTTDTHRDTWPFCPDGLPCHRDFRAANRCPETGLRLRRLQETR